MRKTVNKSTRVLPASPQILNLPPCKSYLSHQRPLPWQEHTGSWTLPWSPFNFAEGVTRIPAGARAVLIERKRSCLGPKCKQGRRVWERSHSGVCSRSSWIWFELMPTDLLPRVQINSRGRCLAGQLLAFQFKASTRASCCHKHETIGERENVRVAFWWTTFVRSTDQRCHMRSDLKPHWSQHTQPLGFGNSAH